jgi:Tn3 transposase DDE domain
VRQNGLAKALREIGRIERTLFTLDWIKNPDLRRRAHLGLNKGEARNALARAVYFCRLGEMRDRTFENQFFRASGLNLLVAAIILWNTRYLEAAYRELRRQGRTVKEDLLRHVAPFGWEHIDLTGDYVWRISLVPARSGRCGSDKRCWPREFYFCPRCRTLRALSCSRPNYRRFGIAA